MKRFADDPQALPALRSMIAAARTDQPSAAALARVLARVEGGAPPSSGPGATRLVLLAGGAGIAALVAIAIAVSPAGRPAPAARAVPPSHAAPAVASVPPPPPAPEVAPAAAATTPPAASGPQHVSPPVRSKQRAQPAPPPAIEPPALPSEVTLVERARSALVRGDVATALAATGEHASRYPDGVLVEEREAIAIEALAATGRLEDGHARLARFVRRFPESSYRRHLEQLIGP